MTVAPEEEQLCGKAAGKVELLEAAMAEDWTVTSVLTLIVGVVATIGLWALFGWVSRWWGRD